MKERPILFSGPMVRAILDGRKTQTRRLVPKWQQPAKTEDGSRFISVAQRHPRWGFGVFGRTEDECMANYRSDYKTCCPCGEPGSSLWVRETWGVSASYDGTPPRDIDPGAGVRYPADGVYSGIKFRPSIHMPRWASRISLEITDVRVERLQDISEEDGKSEGLRWHDLYQEWGGVEAHPDSRPELPQWRWYENPVDAFRNLWESINGPGSWDANPWVWVVEFNRVTGDI